MNKGLMGQVYDKVINLPLNPNKIWVNSVKDSALNLHNFCKELFPYFLVISNVSVGNIVIPKEEKKPIDSVLGGHAILRITKMINTIIVSCPSFPQTCGNNSCLLRVARKTREDNFEYPLEVDPSEYIKEKQKVRSRNPKLDYLFHFCEQIGSTFPYIIQHPHEARPSSYYIEELFGFIKHLGNPSFSLKELKTPKNGVIILTPL